MTLVEAEEEFDFDNLQEYPNVGYFGGDIQELSFNGNSLLRAYNSELLMTAAAEEEYKKCENNYLYFIENYCYIQSLDYGVIKAELRDYQKEFLDIVHNERKIIGLLARQIGKTTSMALYVTWALVFNKSYNVGIVANKSDMASEIVGKVKEIYELLPSYLQHGVKKWNAGSIHLSNGSRIYSAVASGSALRGRSIHLLLIDEHAFIEGSKIKAFNDSVMPSLSSGSDTKIVIISTPNGYNHYYDVYKGAQEGINGYKYYFADWKSVPGRDEEWKKKEIESTSPLEFAQNHGCSFIGSSSTLLNTDALTNFEKKKPIQEDYLNIDGLNLYRPPNPEAMYIVTCDSSKTVGKDNADNDYISVNVLEMNNKIYQTASFRTNSTHYLEISKMLDKIGRHFNDALVVVENNSGDGQSIVDKLFETFEYENIYKDPKHNGLINGIRTTTSRKYTGLKNLKKLIEEDIFEIYDVVTIDEFFTFIKKGKSYEAQSDSTDDCVMSLCTGLLPLEDPLNDLEITIEDYLEGEVAEVDYDEETTDIDFFVSSKNTDVNDNSWLLGS